MIAQVEERDSVLTDDRETAKKRTCQILPICYITKERFGRFSSYSVIGELGHWHVRGGNKLTSLVG